MLRQLFFVKCRFLGGGFPTELFFYVETTAGVLMGSSPIYYCYTTDKKLLRVKPDRDEEVPGYVLGMEVSRGKGGSPIKLQLPDGDIYEIDESQLVTGGGPADVSLQS